uniref:Intradiol dioxygenase isoform X3 n=1 Tax=Tetranychus evansi TaxID=178897 RepID=A0A3G5APH9_9ACAR|nr:intradiol dioxygenase isoform X3 [Tetranychus evansi]
MVKLFTLGTVLCLVFIAATADVHRRGRFLSHDRTVIDCASLNRKYYQHSTVLAPFTTEGPYFLSDDLKRSNITDGQKGIPLELTIRLTNGKDCTPISGFFIHTWQTNATGVYSGINEATAPLSGFRPPPVSNDRSFRGYQETGANGEVKFITIMPGWYSGRAIHIHIEVYAKDITDENKITYIGQFYFQRDWPLRLRRIRPYSSNRQQIVFNEQDYYYVHDHGDETTLDLKRNGAGFSAYATVAIDPTVTIHVQ